MTGADQEKFIGSIRQALDRRPSDPDVLSEDPVARHTAIYERFAEAVPRSRQDLMDLLARLIEESRPINLQVTAHEDMPSAALAIRQLVAEKKPEWGDEKKVAAWRHPAVEALNLPAVLGELDVPVGFADIASSMDRNAVKQWISDSYIGVTSADYCLVDSATMVLKTRPGQTRSVSLVPSIHIAVVYLSQLLADLKELYQILLTDPEHKKEGLTTCMTFITGPSKTADIEATMVHGAHGPREVHLMVMLDVESSIKHNLL